MRINTGKFKGRRFHPPANIPARPTTDFAKEGLFNILTNHFDLDEVSFLDLFGGTGNITYEMASRGCSDLVLVEMDTRSIQFIRKTAESLEIPVQVMQMDVFMYIRSTKKKFDLIFAGPPYALDLITALPDEIIEKELLKEGGIFVLETNKKHNFTGHPHFRNMRNYGTTCFHFFTAEPVTNE